MLAIKECLMREGVFNNHYHNNNNITNNNNNNNEFQTRYDYKYKLQPSGSNMDLLQHQKSVASSSNLSSTSATAKSSCQQQSQQQQLSTNTSKARSSARYIGYHPHFRHHTAPAYYTDIDLRIHTPDAADVAALNENYRSVYSTSSNLIAGEHFFPKTGIATVAPPPIGSANGATATSPRTPTYRPQAAFFRGGSAATEPKRRKSFELYARSSPSSVSPTKGDLNTFSQYENPEGGVLSARIQFKPALASTATAPGSLDSATVGCTESTAVPSPHHSRNSHRFSQRNSKRVVRVRSESRPISALYDIICKEKGLDNGASTTTSDEDSSPTTQHSSDNNNNKNDEDSDKKVKDKDDRYKSRKKKHNKNRAMSFKKIESPPSLVGPKTKNILSSPSRNNNNNNNHDHSKTRSPHIAKKRHSIESNTSPIIHDLNTGDSVDDKPKNNASAKVDHKPRKRGSSSGGGGSKSNHSKASSLPPYKLASEMMNQYHLQQHQQQRHHQQYARNDHPPHNHASHYSLPSNHSLSHRDSPSPHLEATSPPIANIIARSSSIDSYRRSRDLCSKYRPLYVEPVKLPQSQEDLAAHGQTRGERVTLRTAATPRRPHEEQRRNTDGAVSMIPTAIGANSPGGGYRSSDGEPNSTSFADSLSGGGGLSQSSGGTRRFITRPNRTSSRGRNSLNGGIPSPKRSASSSPSPSVYRDTRTTTATKITAVAASAVTSEAAATSEATATEEASTVLQIIDTETHAAADADKISSKPGLKDTNAVSEAVMTNSAASNTATAALAADPANCPSSAASGSAMGNSAIESSSPATCASPTQKQLQLQQQQHRSKRDHKLNQCIHNNIINNNNIHNNNHHTNNNNINNINNNIININTTKTTTSMFKATATTSAPTTTTAKLRKMPPSPLIITQLHHDHHCDHHHQSQYHHQQQYHHHNHHQQQQQQHQYQHQNVQPQQQFSPLFSPPNSPHSPSVHFVRTTKTSRLRAAALDKKKDEEQQQQQQQQQQQRSSTSSLPRRYYYHLSPHHMAGIIKTPRRGSTSSEHQAPNRSPTGTSSEAEYKNGAAPSSPPNRRLRSLGGTESLIAIKKLIPTVSVSMKQNLDELHYNGGTAIPMSPKRKPPQSPMSLRQSVPTSDDYTANVMELPKMEPPSAEPPLFEDVGVSPRPRCSTMHSEKTCSSSQQTASDVSKDDTLELSPVQKIPTPEVTPQRLLVQDRDKSSKRKSNLNRSLNAEATKDSDEAAALRLRRRRELGMARQLIPPDDPVIRELISPKKSSATNNIVTSPKSNHRNDLAYHMENARRGLDLVNSSAVSATPSTAFGLERRRAQTTSPKSLDTQVRSAASKSDAKLTSSPHSNRRSDSGGEPRKLRCDDVNRKLNARTKSDLAEIMKIAEMANAVEQPLVADAATPAPTSQNAAEVIYDLESPQNDNNAFTDLTESIGRIRASREQEPPPESSARDAELELQQKSSADSGTSVYYDNKDVTPVSAEFVTFNDVPEPPLSPDSSNSLHRHRLLKARSIERDENLRISPVLRRKSTVEESYVAMALNSSACSVPAASSAHNHIVSILKKNSGESSSASSNASPVTFSASVLDTPTRHKRAGILKKRSSLDESRYYSRSHSPDDRSILIKSARRNSLEETAAASGGASGQHHGILKQSSYDSCKSDGCPSATELQPHGILKKKDSTSTPSDGGLHTSKHVSISQAVILAAAELCKDSPGDSVPGEYEESAGSYTPGNEDYDLRPILKPDSTPSDESMRQPKPILKKKSSSGDSDEPEIRPILKTSRKSSREEFDMGDDELRQMGSETSMRRILKIESPSKRRSLGNSEIENTSCSQLSLLQRRARSLERQGDSQTGMTASPNIDLAAAMNAIGPQYTSSPLEFVARSSSVSVADRIRSMEKFLKTTTSTTLNSDDTRDESLSAVNMSWESPLQSGAVPKIYRPSAIKREFYLDRYKTQPVTNEEKKMFSKTTSLPFGTNNNDHVTSSITGSAIDSSASSSPPPPPPPPQPSSAFKPTKSSDAFNATNKRSAPPTPPPRPRAATTSGFRCVTREPTIAINSQATNRIEAGPLSSPIPINTPYHCFESSSNNSNIANNTNTANNTNIANNANITKDLHDPSTISVGNDSELIFEMSRIGGGEEADESMPMGHDDTSQVGRAGATPSPPTTTPSVERKNSVRARANMFAQLQEKNKSSGGGSASVNREDQSSPKRAVHRISPASFATPSHDDLNTSGYQLMNPDEDFEPSSLPLSERLRFFSNLSDSGRNSFNHFNATRDSPTHLHSYSSSIERCASASGYASTYFTPRSSISNNSGSSSSVTPTPMECSLGPMDVEDDDEVHDTGDGNSTSTTIGVGSTDIRCATNDGGGDLSQSTSLNSKLLALKKSASQNQVSALSVPQSNANIAELTPTAKRIKLKTIGKLMLPQNFLNVNNRNNSSGEFNKPPMKTIGKIKSPFIENSQQLQQKQQQQHQPQYSSKCMKYDLFSSPSYANYKHACPDSDSKPKGDVNREERDKENIDSSTSSPLQQQHEQPQFPPIVEMRKKFTRIMSGCNITNATATAMRLQQPTMTSQRHTYNGTSHSIDERYAKYFGIPSKSGGGVNESMNRSSLQAVGRVKELPLTTQRHLDFDVLMSDVQSPTKTQQPIAAAVNPNVRPQSQRMPTQQHVGPTTRRRDIVKRSRALTAVISGTPLSSLGRPPASSADSAGGSSGRGGRPGRSLTITHGVPYNQQVPEVQKFEDITVTKEEFLVASKEFDRIFMGGA